MPSMAMSAPSRPGDLGVVTSVCALLGGVCVLVMVLPSVLVVCGGAARCAGGWWC